MPFYNVPAYSSTRVLPLKFADRPVTEEVVSSILFPAPRQSIDDHENQLCGVEHVSGIIRPSTRRWSPTSAIWRPKPVSRTEFIDGRYSQFSKPSGVTQQEIACYPSQCFNPAHYLHKFGELIWSTWCHHLLDMWQRLRRHLHSITALAWLSTPRTNKKHYINFTFPFPLPLPWQLN